MSNYANFAASHQGFLTVRPLSPITRLIMLCFEGISIFIAQTNAVYKHPAEYRGQFRCFKAASQ